MIRKNYMMDEQDIAKLREKMPFDSEATLIRACVKAALELSDEKFRDLCLEAKVEVGPKKTRNK